MAQTFEVYYTPGLSGGALVLPLHLEGGGAAVETLSFSEVVAGNGVYRATAGGAISQGVYVGPLKTSSGAYAGIHYHFRVDADAGAFQGQTFPFHALNEPSGRPEWGDRIEDFIAWLAVLTLHKQTQSATEHRVYNEAEDTVVASRGVSDDATTLTVEAYT